jgi:photosystem II stability/assembly factor-like uncharacterized protein
MDTGASWSKIGEIPTSDLVLNDMSAFDFSKLYTITPDGCYRSTDGGTTWFYTPFPFSSAYACCVCADPVDSNKVYAVGYEQNSFDGKYNLVVFKSTNGGFYWIVRGFFKFDFFSPFDMAISKSNPNIIYIAGVKEVGPSYYGALLESTDGGDNWTDISNSVETEQQVFYSVAIDPNDADRVYVGGSSYLYHSKRTGRNRVLEWTRSSTRLTAFSIDIDPVETSRIYTAGNNNVGVSTDYGQSWTIHNDCIEGSGTHIEVAPATHSTIYVSSDNGFFKSLDFGNSWDFAQKGINLATISALMVAPSQPRTVLVEYYGVGMMGSYDSGSSWDDLGYFVGCGNLCDILINPDNENIVLALEDGG